MKASDKNPGSELLQGEPLRSLCNQNQSVILVGLLQMQAVAGGIEDHQGQAARDPALGYIA